MKAVRVGEDVDFLGESHRIVAVTPYSHPAFPDEQWHVATDAHGWSITATALIPCGWCDVPVPVLQDGGQVVYCSVEHERANVYHAEGAA